MGNKKYYGDMKMEIIWAIKVSFCSLFITFYYHFLSPGSTQIALSKKCVCIETLKLALQNCNQRFINGNHETFLILLLSPSVSLGLSRQVYVTLIGPSLLAVSFTVFCIMMPSLGQPLPLCRTVPLRQTLLNWSCLACYFIVLLTMVSWR